MPVRSNHRLIEFPGDFLPADVPEQPNRQKERASPGLPENKKIASEIGADSDNPAAERVQAGQRFRQIPEYLDFVPTNVEPCLD